MGIAMETQKDIILVNERDLPVGESTKEKVHKAGLLHRAFSVFVLNNKNELLLQQRAFTKYHSPGLWSNTCCSHPKPGEITINAAHRRLREEMGFDCDLKEIFSFVYKSEFENNLIEHEFDHVFIGYYDGIISPNASEVNDYKWIGLESLEDDIMKKPGLYTAWLKICLGKVINYVKTK
jgi:isopentenyl-diphosphate Delta-isomerase